jgi:hypothetical protein
MKSTLTSTQRIGFIDTLKSFMRSDIERGIKAGLNYLVALGLSTYRGLRWTMFWKFEIQSPGKLR